MGATTDRPSLVTTPRQPSGEIGCTPAGAFADRMREAAATLQPYCAESVERYLEVGLTRPTYKGPMRGGAYVADDGQVVLAGSVSEAEWPALRAWIDTVTGRGETP